MSLGESALAFIRKNPELCELPDEHALNALLDGDFVELSPVWNMRPAKRWHAVTHEIARPVIVHHVGEDKPWRRYGYRKRLFPDRTAYQLYESFLKGTPWSGWLDEQWTARDLGKTFAWEVRRLKRRVLGRSTEPSKAQRRAYIDAFRRYCAEGRFADVEQGIVSRENGNLRLKKRAAVA
jgi:lipopolysaccharide biosynthesis glycosyltransferase